MWIKKEAEIAELMKHSKKTIQENSAHCNTDIYKYGIFSLSLTTKIIFYYTSYHISEIVVFRQYVKEWPATILQSSFIKKKKTNKMIQFLNYYFFLSSM